MTTLSGANGAVITVEQAGTGVGIATLTRAPMAVTYVRLDRTQALALRDSLDAIIEQADRCAVCDVRFERGDVRFEPGDAWASGAPGIGRVIHRQCARRAP